MLKKKLKLLVLPVIAGISFITFSSFTDDGEVCYTIKNGHNGPVVLGVQTIVCDGTGPLLCSIKVDCKTGQP